MPYASATSLLDIYFRNNILYFVWNWNENKFQQCGEKKNLVLALALWCILFDVWSWSFFLCLIFAPFSAGSCTYVERKLENTFSLFQWDLPRDQAKLHLCPPVRAGERSSHDSAFSTLTSTPAAGLLLPKIVFRRHSNCISSSSQRKSASVLLLEICTMVQALPEWLHHPLITVPLKPQRKPFR